ncbi:hypothetical protein AMTR_s00087p00099560 [Amborella trichopoda]|uniref:Uncharacterized protein n=1 Tax=Amborella trichopoda TaxID=13333 RepID=W1P4K5_AMBTC|nr:hypothetical protein AMTR_s00087p00099560 [Amborella trichopoda]
MTPTMLNDLVYIQMNSKMMATSRKNEIRDCNAINLEQLGSLPEEVSEKVEHEDTSPDDDDDDAWLHDLGIIPFQTPNFSFDSTMPYA